MMTRTKKTKRTRTRTKNRRLSENPTNSAAQSRFHQVSRLAALTVLIMVLGAAVFARHIAALDIAGLLQALAKAPKAPRLPVRRLGIEMADHRHRRLLRARRERPCRRTAEQRDEIAPPNHSITSSA